MNGKKVDPATVEQFKLLRQSGKSVPEIAIVTGRSKSTVLRYVGEVEILPEYRSEWMGKRGGSKRRMLLREKQAFTEAREIISDLTFREKLLFLSSLYWCEGSKKDFGLSNNDPILIKTFVTLLQDVLKIDKSQIRASIRLYDDLDKDLSLDFWSNLIDIPKSEFVSVNVLNGKKKGKLQFGMCRIRVLKGSDYLKKIVATNRIVSELLVPIA